LVYASIEKRSGRLRFRLASTKEPFEVIEISFTRLGRREPKSVRSCAGLLETAATKSRRSSSQKEVTHQIVKEQETILAMPGSKARPSTCSRKIFARLGDR